MVLDAARKFFNSLKNALTGMLHTLEERNFFIQLVIGVFVNAFAWSLGMNSVERMIILLLSILVLGVEMINSAVEELLDLMVEYHHPRVGKIKDIMAGAVLIFSLGAAMLGIWIFSRALL